MPLPRNYPTPKLIMRNLICDNSVTNRRLNTMTTCTPTPESDLFSAINFPWLTIAPLHRDLHVPVSVDEDIKRAPTVKDGEERD